MMYTGVDYRIFILGFLVFLLPSIVLGASCDYSSYRDQMYTCQDKNQGDILSDDKGTYYCVDQYDPEKDAHRDTMKTIYYDSADDATGLSPDYTYDPKIQDKVSDDLDSYDAFREYNNVPKTCEDRIWPGQKLYFNTDTTSQGEDTDKDEETSSTDDGQTDDDKPQASNEENKQENQQTTKEEKESVEETPNEGSTPTTVSSDATQSFYEEEAEQMPYCQFLKTNKDHIVWNGDKGIYQMEEGVTEDDLKATPTEISFDPSQTSFLRGNQEVINALFRNNQATKDDVANVLKEIYKEENILIPLTINEWSSEENRHKEGRRVVHSPEWCLGAQGNPDKNIHFTYDPTKQKTKMLAAYGPASKQFMHSLDVETYKDRLVSQGRGIKGQILLEMFKSVKTQIKGTTPQGEDKQRLANISEDTSMEISSIVVADDQKTYTAEEQTLPLTIELNTAPGVKTIAEVFLTNQDTYKVATLSGVTNKDGVITFKKDIDIPKSILGSYEVRVKAHLPRETSISAERKWWEGDGKVVLPIPPQYLKNNADIKALINTFQKSQQTTIKDESYKDFVVAYHTFQRGELSLKEYYEKMKPVLIDISSSPQQMKNILGGADETLIRDVVNQVNNVIQANIVAGNVQIWKQTIAVTNKAAAKMGDVGDRETWTGAAWDTLENTIERVQNSFWRTWSNNGEEIREAAKVYVNDVSSSSLDKIKRLSKTDQPGSYSPYDKEEAKKEVSTDKPLIGEQELPKEIVPPPMKDRLSENQEQLFTYTIRNVKHTPAVIAHNLDYLAFFRSVLCPDKGTITNIYDPYSYRENTAGPSMMKTLGSEQVEACGQVATHMEDLIDIYNQNYQGSRYDEHVTEAESFLEDFEYDVEAAGKTKLTEDTILGFVAGGVMSKAVQGVTWTGRTLTSYLGQTRWGSYLGQGARYTAQGVGAAGIAADAWYIVSSCFVQEEIKGPQPGRCARSIAITASFGAGGAVDWFSPNQVKMTRIPEDVSVTPRDNPDFDIDDVKQVSRSSTTVRTHWHKTPIQRLKDDLGESIRVARQEFPNKMRNLISASKTSLQDNAQQLRKRLNDVFSRSQGKASQLTRRLLGSSWQSDSLFVANFANRLSWFSDLSPSQQRIFYKAVRNMYEEAASLRVTGTIETTEASLMKASSDTMEVMRTGTKDDIKAIWSGVNTHLRNVDGGDAENIQQVIDELQRVRDDLLNRIDQEATGQMTLKEYHNSLRQVDGIEQMDTNPRAYDESLEQRRTSTEDTKPSGKSVGNYNIRVGSGIDRIPKRVGDTSYDVINIHDSKTAWTVADGVGSGAGARAAEVAAEEATDVVQQFAKQLSGQPTQEDILELQRVLENRLTSATSRVKEGHKTVFTAQGVTEDGYLLTVSVGDPESFVMRKGTLHKVQDIQTPMQTSDITKRPQLQPVISNGEKVQSGPGSAVYNMYGKEKGLRSKPLITAHKVQKGDRLLSMSDGLRSKVKINPRKSPQGSAEYGPKAVSFDEIEEILTNQENPNSAEEALINRHQRNAEALKEDAASRNAEDDLSTLVVDVQ